MSKYPDQQYQLNNHLPVNQQIYQQLRREIVECMIMPGTALSEKEISARFAVSRQPVRETFIKLAENGLVQILPQRGTFVKKISIKRVNDGRFIRDAIERSIVLKAVELVTPAQMLLLEHNLKRQTLAVQNNLLSEFLAFDDQFHQLLADIADCPLAWETIENIKATMDRVRYMSLSKVSPPSCLLQQHHDIYSAICEGDAVAAERAIGEHLNEIIYTVSSIGEENSEWFEI
ncbi:GntR family transcriptional regulator [Aeromonas cavernicola]|uniref:GntR family transcriptional regulator n=1 Tax=Aeromonas cavernicola TaxID=1006623 RepID=A0A2H9U5G3_9GAMM|nr:GntR family transcriptional regulator [Aeromonas cavernicola]PJG59261.1 GntR family transcriptional regulator [Aeromonas cavernicola]